jgi:hypothetical protein
MLRSCLRTLLMTSLRILLTSSMTLSLDQSPSTRPNLYRRNTNLRLCSSNPPIIDAILRASYHGRFSSCALDYLSLSFYFLFSDFVSGVHVRRQVTVLHPQCIVTYYTQEWCNLRRGGSVSFQQGRLYFMMKSRGRLLFK